jgi:hypothetical protein
MELANFDKKHLDQRGFVIGGGPSILGIQDRGFTFSTLEKEITIATNKAYKLLTPSYLVWSDGYFLKEFKGEIDSIDCIKFCANNVAKKFGVSKQNDTLIIKRGRDVEQKTLVDSFTEPFPMWNNSGVTGLRIAYTLGLNPIYLIGIDIQRLDNKNRTHFHTDYDNARIKKTKDVRYDKFYDSFFKTIEDLKRKKVKVISCSENSRLNTILEYQDLLTVEGLNHV